MNKTLKIILICIATLLAVWAIGHMVIGRVAENKVRKALADIPGARIDFKDLEFSLAAGNLGLRDVEFELIDSTGKGPDIRARIDAIKLEGVQWRSLFRGEARAERLLIRKPETRLTLAKKTKGQKKEQKKEEVSAEASFLKHISLSELKIEKGKIGLESRGNAMKASAQGLGVSVRDIGFQLADGHLDFNDSSYFLTLDSLDFIDETGLNRIRIARLKTADAGPVEALAMHIYNCVPMEQVAERMGKVAAMWYDVQLDSLHTSSLNIPRMVESQRIEIEKIRLTGPKAVVFQDDRYPPAVPYPTLQEGVNTLKLPLKIQQVDARFKSFSFIWETSHVNRGTIPMQNVQLGIRSVGNAPGNKMDLTLKSTLASHGSLNLSVSVRNDKRETTSGKFHITDMDASKLDDFVRPLFGATAKADIHQADGSFQGDKHQMKTEFCMLYDNLSVKAWKDASAPYSIVAKNSGAITFLANLALPNSNPVSPKKEPKKAQFSFDRDPMVPYPAYLIQNLTLGMLHTVLPGATVRKNKK